MQTNTDIESLLGQILFLTPEEKENIRAKAERIGPDGRSALVAYLAGALEKQKETFERSMKKDTTYAEKFLAFLQQAFDAERGRFERSESQNAEHVFDPSHA